MGWVGGGERMLSRVRVMQAKQARTCVPRQKQEWHVQRTAMRAVWLREVRGRGRRRDGVQNLQRFTLNYTAHRGRLLEGEEHGLI